MSNQKISKDKYGNQQWTLQLNKYQRDNLLMSLQAIFEVDPITLLHSGDWVGEIMWMISDTGKLEENDCPNASLESLRSDLEWWSQCPCCLKDNGKLKKKSW